MLVEDEAESRKKLDEQRKRPQRQLREIDRIIDLQQEENLQQQLQEVEQRRNDLLPEHQGYRRGLRRYRVSRTRRKHTKRDCCCSGGDAEDPFVCCRTRSIRIEWQKRKWKQNFQGLQVGEERNGSNASQTVDCCLETVNRGFAPKPFQTFQHW